LGTPSSYTRTCHAPDVKGTCRLVVPEAVTVALEPAVRGPATESFRVESLSSLVPQLSQVNPALANAITQANTTSFMLLK